MFEIFQKIQQALLGGFSGCCIDNRLRVVVMQVTQFLNGADRIRERCTGGNQEKFDPCFVVSVLSCSHHVGVIISSMELQKIGDVQERRREYFGVDEIQKNQ